MRRLVLKLTAAILIYVSGSAAISQAPRILYTDLLSGPGRGGEAGQGAFVTLYGSGFGASRGASTVTVGGGEAYAYPVWSDTRVTIQLGTRARTGLLVAHLTAQSDSNGIPFTVRPGHIFFVAPSGDDDNDGSFQKPWKSLLTAKEALRAGDIVYARDGVTQNTLDKYDSAFSIQTSGTAGAPLALIGYPGAHVTIGAVNGPQIAARTPNIDRSSDHWVLANLTFLGAQEALDITASTDWRIVGNDFSCPEGFGPTGCIETGQASFISFLGNTVHDVAKPRTTKVYHAVYFSTDSNHIDVGWNTIRNVRGCRGLQFHSSPLDPGTGMNQYGLHIHDNIIHDVVCDGINLATVDPSKGPVEVDNNLIYNVGTGPDPEDGGANYACIYVQGGANRGAPGTGTVSVRNNTMDNCGGRANSDSGALALSPGSPQQKVLLQNNIIVLRRGESLLSAESKADPLISQSNLVWSTSRTAAVGLHHAVPQLELRDPRFVDDAHGNYALKEDSPAIGAGTPNHILLDVYGTVRTNQDKPDIGAIEHGASNAHSR